MKNISINAHIGYGDIGVDMEVSEKEYKSLTSAISKSEEGVEGYTFFCENKNLAALYAKIIDAVLNEAANGAADNPFEELGEYDFRKTKDYIAENYDVWVDYSDIDIMDE